ncbi:MAG: putative membrane protein YdjX (TVP38/TMEM64 family) [Planctomycetaceae bacterium]|jgi:uncharacterized membrane protein YdjX (TVP38/TMEM64 family)
MSNRRRVLIGLVFVIVLAAVAVLLPEYASLEVLVRRETTLRESIAINPFQSWMIGFGVYFLASLIPGTGGKSMIFGWLFGLWPAVLMVDAALTLAALATFFISRYLIRDLVESRFTGHVERLNRHLATDGPFYLLQLRMAHAPFTFINYVSGALRVPTRTFWWTTQLGLLPGTIVFVFAGSRLPTLRQLADQGAIRLLDPWLIAGLLLTAILPVIVRSLSRLLRPQSPQYTSHE